MRKAGRLLLVVLVGTLVLKGLVSAFESRLVFFPSPGEDRTPASLGLTYAQVQLRTADGESLVAWQLEPEQPIADVVYFHGNGGNLSVWLPALAGLFRLGLRVLAVDYRGYGLSTGTPSEQGVYLDAEAAVRYAAASRTASRPLIYWGRSLGGPIAASATRAIAPDGVVLESTFPDKGSVIRDQPLLRALNAFSAYRFPTVEFLSAFERPVLVLHGDRDSVIPFELGREVFEALTGPKRFVAVRGGDHNDLFLPDRSDYWQPILDFIGILKDKRT